MTFYRQVYCHTCQRVHRWALPQAEAPTYEPDPLWLRALALLGRVVAGALVLGMFGLGLYGLLAGAQP